jgi:hypothetical protein
VNNAGLNRDGVVWKMTDDAGPGSSTPISAQLHFTRAVSIFREAGAAAS